MKILRGLLVWEGVYLLVYMNDDVHHLSLDGRLCLLTSPFPRLLFPRGFLLSQFLSAIRILLQPWPILARWECKKSENMALCPGEVSPVMDLCQDGNFFKNDTTVSHLPEAVSGVMPWVMLTGFDKVMQ